MKIHTTIAPVLAFAAVLVASAARADKPEPPPPPPTAAHEHPETGDIPGTHPALRPGFGARVGGYSFRDGNGQWGDCKMGGVGVFGTLDVGRFAFFELGLDSYQSVPGSVPADEGGMERSSFTMTGAVGVRMFPDFFVVPFVEAGGGLDWTRVSVAGARAVGTYPVGFFGLGAELNVFKHFKGGITWRMLEMARPQDDGATLGAAAALPMQIAPASQGQIFLRYVL